MPDTNKTDPTVVRFPAGEATDKAAETKWGKPVIRYGFTIAPSLLMQAQRRLGLSPLQFNIILHLMDFWWEAGRKPFPSKKEIAERMDIHPRTVQKNIKAMQDQGLVKRIPRITAAGDPGTNFYDLSGLVNRLKTLEPEFRKAKENRQEIRRAVAKPKGRRIVKA